MYELLHSIWAYAPTLRTIAVGQSDPSGAVQTCSAKNAAQSQTKYRKYKVVDLNPGSAILSCLWVRTVLCSISEETCLGCMPQWLGETCCEQGKPKEYEH